MEIKMYNVDFGDCFLICNEEENLLVDFGSDDTRCLPRIADQLDKECQGKPLSVLCTHFHNDHINGMLRTDFPFEREICNLYLPDILGIGDKPHPFGAFQVSILSDILDSIVLQKRPLFITLHDFINKLFSLPRNILAQVFFLSRSDTFSVGTNNFTVLWPTKTNGCLDARTLRSTKKLLLDLGLARSELITPEVRPIDLDEISIDLGVLDLYTEKLFESYCYLRNMDAFLGRRESLHSELTTLYNEVCAEVDNRTICLTDKLRAEIKAKSKTLHENANKYSIVFQSFSPDSYPCILMTGDITQSPFKKILTNHSDLVTRIPVYPYYHLIKAPHHATETHYCFPLPNCEVMFASNGDTELPSRGLIYREYGIAPHPNPNRKMLCSNCRCELVRVGKGHECSYCTKGSHPVINYP